MTQVVLSVSVALVLVLLLFEHSAMLMVLLQPL